MVVYIDEYAMHRISIILLMLRYWFFCLDIENGEIVASEGMNDPLSTNARLRMYNLGEY